MKYTIIYIFYYKIFINKNLNGSIIVSSTYFKENKNEINNLPIPYLKINLIKIIN